jgi:DNA polymerase-3 subunit beta
MRFTVQNQELSNAIGSVSRAVSAKTALSVLECVRIEANGGALKLTGSDTEITVITAVPAEILREGSVLVPLRTLGDLVRTYPDEAIDFTVDEKNVLMIQCASSEVTILGRDAADYPDIKSYEDKGIEADSGLFRDMIRTTVFACAPQININPVLMGVYVQYEGNVMRFTALDGCKFAQRKAAVAESVSSPIGAIVPGRGMNELKILSAYEEDISFMIKDKRFVVNVAKTQVIVNLLEGAFINYERLLPKQINTTVTIGRQRLLVSMERASLITDETRNSLIKMDFEADTLHLSSHSDKGNVSDDIEIKMQGADLKVAFNARYFVEILKNIKDDEIVIHFKDNSGPCMITPTGADAFLYLVMPVRYKD